MDTVQHPALSRLAEALGDGVVEAGSPMGEATAIVKPELWETAARLLKEDAACQFNLLVDLTLVDYLSQEGRPRFEVVAHFHSIPQNQRIRLKTRLDDGDLELPTLTALWGNANWLEREAYDMFGIRFRGHPQLRRILLYEEFQGHPLRKGYPLRGQQPLVSLLEVIEPVTMSSEPQRFPPEPRFKT